MSKHIQKKVCQKSLQLISVFTFICSHQRLIFYINIGDHGYNNEEMDMKTIFRGFGPKFKKNFTSEPFDSIHIYPLMCRLLEIEPAPHNGSLSVVDTLLVPRGEFTLRHIQDFLGFKVLRFLTLCFKKTVSIRL